MKEFDQSHESSMKDKLTLVILGRSGSGKGTQARRIVARLRSLGGLHVSTGELIRKFMRGRSPAAAIARRVMKQGGLHPSWLAAYLWLGLIVVKGGGTRHLIFDGACRRLFEAKLLDEVMVWYGRPLPLCIYIDVARKEAMRRLLGRGRADDTVPAIKKRLDYFSRDVVPVLRYYQNRGRMIRVDGSSAPGIVAKELDLALQKKMGKTWPSASKVGKR